MTYSELFHRFKTTISPSANVYKIASAHRRLLIMAFFSLFWFVGTIVFFFDFSIEAYSKMFCLLITGIILLTFYYKLNVKEKNKKDLLSKYSDKYAFTEIEKESSILILDRIKREELINAIGEKASNLEYLKKLIENSEEYSSITKTELNYKNLGIAAIILIIINSYFSSLFNRWVLLKADPYHVAEKTAVITLTILLMGGMFYVLQFIIQSEMNTNHYKHKELNLLLKDLKMELEFR